MTTPTNPPARPDPPESEHAGYAYVAVSAGLDWRLVTGRRCRWMEKRKSCGRPSVAELNRSTRPNRESWWAYCEQHLYGRWVEDGQVMQWVLREISDGADTPTARLHADVAAAQAHHDAVEHAAVQLGYTGHKALAQRLTDTWEAFGVMPSEDVRALPPEPEVGRTVEVVGGDRAGQRMHRTDEDRIYRWRMPSGELIAWPTPLVWAGPAGVRVLGGGTDG